MTKQLISTLSIILLWEALQLLAFLPTPTSILER